MAPVVLFGAGASFGSADVSPNPPPLGYRLFERIENEVGLPPDFPADLKPIFKQDFEKGMAAFYERTNGNTMQFQRKVAFFLAGFSPGKRNIYRRLLLAIGNRRVVYSSLNYDMLFELSAAALGFGTSYYVQSLDTKVSLLKLHGSCNFWPALPKGIRIIGAHFEGAGGADVVAPIEAVNRTETLRRATAIDTLAPAMSLYAPGKAVRISPEFVKEQQRQWREAIANSHKVFVIGVRVNLADDHIWDVLGSCAASVTYFGISSGDESEFAIWRDKFEKRNAYFVKSDFAGSVPFIARSIAGDLNFP